MTGITTFSFQQYYNYQIPPVLTPPEKLFSQNIQPPVYSEDFFRYSDEPNIPVAKPDNSIIGTVGY